MESTPARGAGPELTNEGDADLLVYMGLADSDLVCARAAWDVFYRRHVEYLYRVCLRAYGDILGGEAGVADLVAEAFRAAYENAHKFDPAGITDANRLRRRVRAWLGWIARRLVQDILRGRSRLPTRALELDHWQQVAEPERLGGEAGNEPSPKEKAVRQAVESLSEREQLVIRTTLQWYHPEKQHQRLPNDIAADLGRTLGTTPENLRQIRRRAMRKSADFLHVRTAEPQKKEKSNG